MVEPRPNLITQAEELHQYSLELLKVFGAFMEHLQPVIRPGGALVSVASVEQLPKESSPMSVLLGKTDANLHRLSASIQSAKECLDLPYGVDPAMAALEDESKRYTPTRHLR